MHKQLNNNFFWKKNSFLKFINYIKKFQKDYYNYTYLYLISNIICSVTKDNLKKNFNE